MDVKDRQPCPGGTGNPLPPPPPAATGTAAASGLDTLLDRLAPATVTERRPVIRLAPGREPTVAAERLIVSRSKLAAVLGSAAGEDEDLLRHASDRVAARLPGSGLLSGSAEWPTARLPVLLPLPLRPLPAPAPRPGLIGVLPLAAMAAGGVAPAERRAGLAALGWRLGIGGLHATALRLVALSALPADLLLLRWSPTLAREWDARCGVALPSLVLTGCDGAEAVRWGQGAGFVLFSGPGAEAMLPAPLREIAP
jgi:hypothetical protein